MAPRTFQATQQVTNFLFSGPQNVI